MTDEQEAEKNKAILLRRREVAARVMRSLADEMGTTRLTSPDDVATVLSAIASVAASVLHQVCTATKLHYATAEDMLHSFISETYVQIENDRQSKMQAAN